MFLLFFYLPGSPWLPMTTCLWPFQACSRASVLPIRLARFDYTRCSDSSMSCYLSQGLCRLRKPDEVPASKHRSATRNNLTLEAPLPLPPRGPESKCKSYAAQA